MKKGYFSGFLLILLLFLCPIRGDAASIIDGVMVIDEDETIAGPETISADVKINKGVTLTTIGDVTIEGDVYVYGTFTNHGTLIVSKTVNCLHYGYIMSAGDYDYGYFFNNGRANIYSLNVTDSYLNNYNPGEPGHEHIFREWHTSEEPTCISNGTEVRECLECGYQEKRYIPKTGIHKFEEWRTIRIATCISDGEEIRNCTECGYQETQSIPMKKEHIFGEWFDALPATCLNEGISERTCLTCSFIETKAIPKKEHIYNSWEVVYSPTIYNEGLEERYCSECKIIETRNIPKLQQPTTEVPSTETPSTPKPSQPEEPSVLALNTSRIVMQVGKSFSGVKADYITKGDKIVRWKSSKPSVVSVNRRGKLTAKKVGTARITAYTNRGAEGAFTVRVQKKKVSLSSINVKKRYVTLKLKNGKKTYQIQAVKTPMTYSGRITYKSANRKIATVNSKGKITAKKAGKTKIYVKCGKKTVTVRVTVKKR